MYAIPTREWREACAPMPQQRVTCAGLHWEYRAWQSVAECPRLVHLSSVAAQACLAMIWSLGPSQPLEINMRHEIAVSIL